MTSERTGPGTTCWANRALNALGAIAIVAAAVVYSAIPQAQASGASANAITDDLSAQLANRPSHVSTSWDGLAAGGFDVVAFFIDNAAMRGDRAITTSYDGATYRFATEANRTLFLKDPASLVPQYGGYGAMGVRKGKKLRPDKSAAWLVADEKLYLFIDDETKAMWTADRHANERIAHAIWAQIRDVPIHILTAPATH